jgi:protein-disulfide isomerase
LPRLPQSFDSPALAPAPVAAPRPFPRSAGRFAARLFLIVGLTVAGATIAGAAAPEGGANADTERLAERTMGEPNAPVTINEFSSLTCPHCAHFDAETLPKIKAEFIDTGKAKLVFRDFPLDRLALAAAVVARCVKPAQYFGFISMLFHDQRDWATAKDPLAELKTRARLAGVGEAEVDACLSDQTLITTLQKRRDAASKEFDINATPTFVINGQTVSGDAPFDDFKSVIEAALAKAKAN